MANLPDLIGRLCISLSEFSPLIRDDYGEIVYLQLDLQTLFRQLRGLTRVVVVTCERIEKSSTTKGGWLRDLLAIVPQGNIYTEIILTFLAGPGSRGLAHKHLASFSDLRGQPVIDLEKYLGEKERREFLRRTLLEQCDVQFLNPYGIEVWAPPPMFYGRDEMLRELTLDRTNQVIVGARRIGKSSLANRLKNELGTFLLPPAGPGRSARTIPRCVYIDVTRCPEPVASSLWDKILRGFAVDRRDLSVGGWRSDLFGRRRKEERAGIFDEFSALKYLLSRSSGHLTVILDEVDAWLFDEATRFWPSLNRLRELTESGKARVILVGYEVLAIAATHHKFPLLGRVRQRLIGTLEFGDVERLIFEPLAELDIVPEARSREQILNRIWQTTSGLPHLVQDICKLIVNIVLGTKSKSRKRLLAMKDVDSAINQSSEIRKLRENLVGNDFPLARALAGVCSLGHSGSEDSEGKDKDEDNYSGRPLAIQEMARRLEDFGYRYDDEEMRLALTWLELRLILQPFDPEKTRWVWVNDLARRSMEHELNYKGYDRIMKAIIRDHEKGAWRSNFKSIFGGWS